MTFLVIKRFLVMVFVPSRFQLMIPKCLLNYVYLYQMKNSHFNLGYMFEPKPHLNNKKHVLGL